jgi:propanediol dehydratase small subunit
LATSNFYTVFAMELDASDYPLGSYRPDLLATPGGIPFAELSLDRHELTAAELRASPVTLRLQAEVARDAGRQRLADNLDRASELATIPDEVLLEIYTALRPRRSTAAELQEWAERLEGWGAWETAAFVLEAAQVYAERGLLSG